MRALTLTFLLMTFALAAAGSRPIPPPLPPPQSWAQFMGITAFDASVRTALRIETIRSTSFADVIGLRAEDVILALNDFPVANADGFQAVATWLAGNQPARWRFTVAREGVEEPITVTPAPGFACDPLKLIGCGPLPRRTVK